MPEPNHARRIAVLWLVASLIATPLVAFVLGPHLAPGHASAEAAAQTRDNTVLAAVMTPIVCLILVYLGYALIVFRQRGPQLEEGARIHGHARTQNAWVITTSIVVLAFAAFGTVELLNGGAGGGQGPNPLAKPSGSKLPVQVIGQQWEFTYRYPTYGGVETAQLVLPAGQTIELHVTSLDAVHSFWAYNLGVKADANPNVDNVAYVKPRGTGTFQIHCAELCGLWHGYMFQTGRIVSPSAFAAWIRQQQEVFAPVARYVPRYSRTYSPEPQRRAG